MELSLVASGKMAVEDGRHDFDDVLLVFEEHTKSPEIYVEPQQEIASKLKLVTKQLYNNILETNFLTDLKSRTLPKLLIDGFDEEQIWQQIELQNKSAVPHFSKLNSKIDPRNVHFFIDEKDETLSKEEVSIHNGGLLDGHASSGDEEYVFDDDSDASLEISNSSKHDLVRKEAKKKIASKTVKYSSEVDDQFFKLSKLEQFLKIEDLKEERGEPVSPDADNIDLFQDIPSDGISDLEDESSDEEPKIRKKSSRDFMYEDFFDAPESGDETILESDEDDQKCNVKLDETEQVLEDSEVDDQVDNIEESEIKAVAESGGATAERKTAFELEQEKIKKAIQECEKSMLEPLPWHLTGEVAASSRPIDSLIHQETEFDCNAKQDLVVDNALTEKVENIIKTAILNKAFNDVERKVKSTNENIAYKKEIVLEQAKSKKGLAEVYEEEYLKRQAKQKEEEDPKHKEINKLMDSLFPELYALFAHVPKPAVPEIKIVSNLPAVTAEEVAPTSVSDVTLLAPEEVKKKSGLIKGKTERTDTDRKHERRKKKLHQKFKARKINISKPNENVSSAKMKKLEKLQILKKLKQHRNTKIADVDFDGKIASSKDFFSRLQDLQSSKKKKREK